MAPTSALLEVGRITKPHGLRGEVAGAASSPTEPSRLAPGSVLLRRRPRTLVVDASRPHQHRWIVALRRCRRPRGGRRAARRRAARAEADRRRRRRCAVGARADRRRGRRPSTASTCGAVDAVQANPASDLLVLDIGRAGAAAFVVGGSTTDGDALRDRSARRPVRLSEPWQADAHAHRRLHDLPRHGRALRRPRACSAGPAQRACSTCGCTTCARPPPTRTARSTTRRSAAERAWCSCPSRSSPPSRRSSRRGRCSCSGPGGRRFDQALARELAGARRLLAAVRPLRRRRRAGARRTSSTASSRSATTCWPAARWRPWWCSRRSAGWCPGVMGNDDVGRRRVVQRRAARVPAVHPAGRVPGLGGARGAALGRPRPGRPLAAGPGPAPHPRRRPDLIEARGGLTADEQRLLDEFRRRP